ncbi:hypothetical protein Sjap_011401 [Stephania japonica]|uniref:Inositol polyphosphate multikinase n=1 Tax=Stephania japonica TaxID=461633 RepID=A0AAP0P5I4_9MAGN
MLKVPDHQVAGHQARDGMLGPLVDDSGRFYKPLQDDERGSTELAFYTSLSHDNRIPDDIRQFFPIFYGTQLVEASNGTGLQPHLVLQNLMSNHNKPSVMDVKIGSRTWYPQASEDYIQKCFKKDKETTSLTLGFRISGLQAYENEESGFWKPKKKQIQGFNAEDVKLALRKFVSSNPLSCEEPDCSLAETIYNGTDGILAQLEKLKEWFEDQTIFHFYSCSVLMIYEKELAAAGRSAAQIKLVDFAHVLKGEGVIDHNFLGGFCSLIKFVCDILNIPREYTAKNSLSESEKNQSYLENGSI